jgi:dTDP-4-dehydrorhamnose reductase
MKILILGSSGILGKTLKFYLTKKKVKIYLILRKKNKKNFFLNDFTNFDKLKKIILDINPSHIVNCLGVTKFNNSYNLIKTTKLINSKLPKTLSNFCEKKKIFFVHISTDCVFTGKKGYYKDASQKDSMDLYGLSKNKGEVKNKYTSTIRTSFIGPETRTKKSLLNWFLAQKIVINGFNNAFFSGLTSLELCEIIYKYFIKENKFYNKIINVGGNRISKYSLLKTISKVFKKDIHIKKLSNFKIDRSLDSKNFKKISKYKTKSWEKMIKDLRHFMLVNKYKF